MDAEVDAGTVSRDALVEVTWLGRTYEVSRAFVT